MKTILLMITLFTLSSASKDMDCSKLLKRSINDLNRANTSKRIDMRNMYATRSVASSNIYKLCIEVNEDFSVDKIKKMLKKVK